MCTNVLAILTVQSFYFEEVINWTNPRIEIMFLVYLTWNAKIIFSWPCGDLSIHSLSCTSSQRLMFNFLFCCWLLWSSNSTQNMFFYDLFLWQTLPCSCKMFMKIIWMYIFALFDMVCKELRMTEIVALYLFLEYFMVVFVYVKLHNHDT